MIDRLLSYTLGDGRLFLQNICYFIEWCVTFDDVANLPPPLRYSGEERTNLLAISIWRPLFFYDSSTNLCLLFVLKASTLQTTWNLNSFCESQVQKMSNLTVWISHAVPLISILLAFSSLLEEELREFRASKRDGIHPIFGKYLQISTINLTLTN